MPLQVDQHRRTAGLRHSLRQALNMAPAPVRHRNRQRAEQHVVDAAVECRWHPRQQRLRHLGRQAHGQVTRRAEHVAHRVELALRQLQRRQVLLVAPERKLLAQRCASRMPSKPRGPAPERGAPLRQRHRLPGRNLPPRRLQVRHQDPPRHPVDRKMMDAKKQPPRPLRPGIEPHRLQHQAGRRIEPPLGSLRLQPRSAPATLRHPRLGHPRLGHPRLGRPARARRPAAAAVHSAPLAGSPAASRRPHQAEAAAHRDAQAAPQARPQDDPPSSPPAPSAASPG